MQYFAEIRISKAMSQVIAHIDVYREQSSFPYRVKVYQRTELFNEESHPEPEKWALAHTAMLLETL